MSATVRCEDGYEAQKLAGLIYSEDAGGTLIASVVNVIGREVIISLRDGSAHSITMRGEGDVEAFADFCQSVADGADVLVSSEAEGDTVRIAKRGA